MYTVWHVDKYKITFKLVINFGSKRCGTTHIWVVRRQTVNDTFRPSNVHLQVHFNCKVDKYVFLVVWFFFGFLVWNSKSCNLLQFAHLSCLLFCFFSLSCVWVLFIVLSGVVFRRVRNIANSDCYLRHVCPSVCPHVTTRLPLDGFSWNLISEYFSNICRENSSFITIWRQ